MSTTDDEANDIYVRYWKARCRQNRVCAARGSGVKLCFLQGATSAANLRE
jgi:hypothetical protein